MGNAPPFNNKGSKVEQLHKHMLSERGTEVLKHSAGWLYTIGGLDWWTGLVD